MYIYIHTLSLAIIWLICNFYLRSMSSCPLVGFFQCCALCAGPGAQSPAALGADFDPLWWSLAPQTMCNSRNNCALLHSYSQLSAPQLPRWPRPQRRGWAVRSFEWKNPFGYWLVQYAVPYIELNDLCQSGFFVYDLWLATVPYHPQSLWAMPSTAYSDFSAWGPTELVAFHQPNLVLSWLAPQASTKLPQDLQKPQQHGFRTRNSICHHMYIYICHICHICHICPKAQRKGRFGGMISGTKHIIMAVAEAPTCTSRSTHRPKATKPRL